MLSAMALEEADMLMRSMSEHLKAHDATAADALLARAEEAKRQSDAIRHVIANREPLPVKA